MTDTESFRQFAADLCATLTLDPLTAARLAEILDDRMKEIADKAASEARDREFNRGDYRY